MNVNWISLFTFVIVTTFTPGPNNITCSSMGIRFGYKKTLGYISGIVTGFVLIMLICASLSTILNAYIFTFEKYIRIAGSLYIFWLAINSLKLKYDDKNTTDNIKSFSKGLLLQLVNPKVVVYGLTLYSTFLSNISNRLFILILLAFLFASVAFLSTSTWALFGSVIRKYLKNDKFKITLNIILCLMLIYIAIDLSGLIKI